jgi:uncharacterized protein YcbK (DUF882 family)
MSRTLAVLVAILTLSLGVDAEAGKKKSRKNETSLAKKKRTKVKVCSTKEVKKGKKVRKKKVCNYHKQYEGSRVAEASLRTEPLERPSGEIWLRSDNLREEVKVNIYAADGGFDDAALAQLDEVFRCRRANEVRAVDPRLYEQLSRIYDHFEQKMIVLVSGFRYKEDDSSRHYHASAMDIRISGHSIKEIYEYAESLDMGGMGIGIYPNSGFVHVDFRAPGERSTRWTDWSYPGSDGKASEKRAKKSKKKSKDKPRTAKAKKPTS